MKAELERAIEGFIAGNCEDFNEGGLVHDKLAVQMASAAEAVFDASFCAQKFKEEFES